MTPTQPGTFDEVIRAFALGGWDVAQSGSDYAVFTYAKRQRTVFAGRDRNVITGRVTATLRPDGKFEVKLENGWRADGYTNRSFKKIRKSLRKNGTAK